jgi:hypothetical protein
MSDFQPPDVPEIDDENAEDLEMFCIALRSGEGRFSLRRIAANRLESLQAENARLTSEVRRLHNLLRESLLHMEGAKMSVCSMSDGRLKATIRNIIDAKP